MDELTQKAKDRYCELDKLEESLKNQLSEIQSEKKPIKIFLTTTGVLQKPPRKTKPTSIK